MTCKDCLHYEACRDTYDDLVDRYDNLIATNYNSVFDEEDYARIGCANFTDSSEKGKWILEKDPNGDPYYFHCSKCDGDFSNIAVKIASKFCLNCGSKMDNEHIIQVYHSGRRIVMENEVRKGERE